MGVSAKQSSSLTRQAGLLHAEVSYSPWLVTRAITTMPIKNPIVKAASVKTIFYCS